MHFYSISYEVSRPFLRSRKIDGISVESEKIGELRKRLLPKKKPKHFFFW